MPLPVLRAGSSIDSTMASKWSPPVTSMPTSSSDCRSDLHFYLHHSPSFTLICISTPSKRGASYHDTSCWRSKMPHADNRRMPSRLRHGIRRYLRLALFEAQSLLFLLYIFYINGRSYFSTFPHIQLSVLFVLALVPVGRSQI
jgi:hypothetical protein